MDQQDFFFINKEEIQLIQQQCTLLLNEMNYLKKNLKVK